MLSDEEKKAIKELTEIKELFEEDLKENYEVTATLDQIDLESLVIVLNLIEKQQKEIEELKEDNKHQWEERCKLTFELENSTSNDKIKAKIEEVEQWELYNMKIPRLSTLDERLGAKIGIKYVLQSLLEEKE